MTVTPVSDPCVGNLATPVNSGYFIKGLINNLPFTAPASPPISVASRPVQPLAICCTLLHHLWPLVPGLSADRRSAGRNRRRSHSQPALLAVQPARQTAQYPPADATVENPLPICLPAPAGPTSPAASGWVVGGRRVRLVPLQHGSRSRTVQDRGWRLERRLIKPGSAVLGDSADQSHRDPLLSLVGTAGGLNCQDSDIPSRPRCGRSPSRFCADRSSPLSAAC